MRSPLNLISLLFCLLCLLATSSARAENRVLSGESVASDGNNLKLEIRFEQPMNYVSHFPEKSGKELDIKLRPISSTALGLIQSSIEDVISPEKFSGSPIVDIRYEQDEVGNGDLTIQFKSEYAYTVESSTDHLSIIVTLLNVLNKQEPAKGTSQSPAAQAPAVSVDSGLPIYVINLQTDDSYLDPEKQPVLRNFRRRYEIFTIQSKQGRKTLYQLRLGYFHSLKLAKEDVKRLKPFYPQAWVDKVSPEHRQVAENWFFEKSLSRLSRAGVTPPVPPVPGGVLPSTKTTPATTAKPATEVSQPKTTTTAKTAPATAPVSGAETAVSNTKQAKLLEIAKQAMISKDYRKAVNYLTHILQGPNSAEHKQAQELLGLARERQGLPAQAAAEYEKYLQMYPTGADSDRVRQRLNGLLTARAQPNAKLSQVASAPKPVGPAPEWNMFGSFTQFYRNQQATNVDQTVTTDNSLSTDLIVSARRRGPEWNQRIDFAGNHRYDFLADTNASNGTIYSMFYELAQKSDDFSMRLGRQTHNSDGVLGRFDGVIFNKRIGHHKKVSLLAGYPVDIFLRDSVNTNRQFYAGSIKFESVVKNLDTKFYYISQSNYGMTDRQAIGNETQYVDSGKTLFFITDYDTFYKKLNQFTFVGNWRNKKNSSLNIVADYRNSPLLTTNNALIGQTSTTLEQLRQTFSLDQVQQLAQDRTGSFKSLTVSASTQLSPRYQLNGDMTASKLEGTPASGGVDATEGTDVLYYYNLALVGTNMLSSNDVSIAGLRYNTDVTSHTISANFSTRLNSGKKWRFNPRMSIDWRSNDDGTKRTTYTPRLVLQYRATRTWRFEMEFGYQKTVSDPPTTNFSDQNYYGYFGYIHDF